MSRLIEAKVKLSGTSFRGQFDMFLMVDTFNFVRFVCFFAFFGLFFSFFFAFWDDIELFGALSGFSFLGQVLA